MKKISLIMLVTILAICLIGCGGSETGKNTDFEQMNEYDAWMTDIVDTEGDDGYVYIVFINEHYHWDDLSADERKEFAKYAVERCKAEALEKEVRLDMVVGQTDDMIIAFSYDSGGDLIVFKDSGEENTYTVKE